MKLTRTLLALSLAGITAPALAGITDDLKQLLADGKAGDAYALVQANPDHLGEPLVDFYYGIAATDSGHASEGVLALERYVLTFPRNHAARLELARALFIAGDNERAYEEFSAVRKNSTDRAELATIDRYLDAIKVRRTRYQPSWGGYVELGAGYDSNVNGGVDTPGTVTTKFGPSTIRDPSLAREDSYQQLEIGLKGSYPIAPGLILQGGAIGNTRYLNNNSDLDQNSLAGWGGLTWYRGDAAYALYATKDQIEIDSRRFRTQTGIGTGVSYQLDELQSISANLQVGDVDYAQNNYLRNAKLQGLTLGWRRALIHPLQPVITLQGNWTREANQYERPDLGREYTGARVAFAITPAARWGLGGGYTWQHSDYAGTDPLFLKIRRDTYEAFDLTATYRLDRQWTLRGSYITSHNDSNIALYDYRRNVVEVALRYAF